MIYTCCYKLIVSSYGGSIVKGKMIAVIVIVVAVLVVAVTAGVMMSGSNQANVSQTNNGGNGGNGNGSNTTSNLSFTVKDPTGVNSSAAKVSLSANYDGSGASGYAYKLNNPYNLSITAKSLGNFSGNAVIFVFAQKSNTTGIGTGSIKMTSSNGTVVNWTAGAYNGTSMIIGHTDIFSLNSSTSSNMTAYHVSFNNVGTFNLTFQAFDASTGKPLSAPLNATGLNVPVTGTLKITNPSAGNNTNISGTQYRVLLISITNKMNVPYMINASYLMLSNGVESTGVATDQMQFSSEQPSPGQTVQFLAYFPLTSYNGNFTLVYNDPTVGTINVPLK